MRVAIAEDSALFREGLTLLLGSWGVEVTAAVPSVEDLMARVPEDVPDAVILDIRMPPTFTDEGLKAAEELRERYPRLGILVLSTYPETSYVVRLLKDGEAGLGYLLKDTVADAESLKDSLERVTAGECVIDQTLVGNLISNRGRRDRDLSLLTDRELQVFRLMAEGYSNMGIADSLSLSQRTIEVHLARIFAKLGISSKPEMNSRVMAVLAFLRSSKAG